MTASLSIKNSINNLENLFNDINAANNAYYFFVGHTLPWPDDTNPPAAAASIVQTEQNIYHEMVFGKQITNNNIAFLIPNIPWTPNTVYTAYDYNNPNYYGSNSYVVTSTYSVYKCIDNNSNGPSTVQPFITPTVGTFQTSDGYTWKYMYTVPVNANTAFTTNQFIPVVPNTYVANNAIPGSLDVIRINNGGANWQAYEHGYLNSVISQQTFILDANAVNVDNFYTGSSLYLKSGLGADQIRPIVSYSGANQTVTVSPAFNTFVNIQLNSADITGTFLIGETVVQNIVYYNYLYGAGSFNTNDLLIQSDSQASGYVSHANTTSMQLYNVSGTFNPNNYPIFNSTDSLYNLTGTVSITSGSNTLTGVTANLLTLSVNTYIQVGNNANLNVRRISSITNSTQAHVSVPFNYTLVGNSFAQVNNAVEPTSFLVTSSNGVITQLNTNSIMIQYGNLSSNGITFIPGEVVKEVDINNVDQSSNGIISFANSTSLIISNINGTLLIGDFIIGQSSALKAQITGIKTYPNITLANALGTFITGIKVYAQYANGVTSGSGTCVSYSYTPSKNTEYIISPTVVINGDGNGAAAYSVVNTAPGSVLEVSDIVMINTGNSYTYATAYLSSNALYGYNASLYPVVSPVQGHGADAVTELGAKFGGISMTFDTAANENYYYPSYGTYRKVGIIKNPLFSSLYVSHSAPNRLNMTIQGVSGSFSNGEIIYQYSTNAAALIKSVNSTFIQIDNINGTFTSNAAQTGVNNMIVGLTSNALANVVVTNSVNFSITSNNQPLYQSLSNTTGILTNVINSSMVVLGNVSGNFLANSTIYDPTNNAHANVLNFYVANGSQLTTNFGQKFDQSVRITLSSNNNLPFQVNETVAQYASNSTGTVYNVANELDFIIANVSGTFSLGTVLTDNTTFANGIITFANNSYIKITAANGSFNSGDTISCLTGNGVITSVLSVIVLNATYGTFVYNHNIYGWTSGAIGYTGIANTITYPDLVFNSGEVLYINNIQPFTLGSNTKEVFLTTLQF
jgi:hypothetical protein